jgi:hypothetical protein
LPRAAPPADPAIGASYIVAEAATGVWVGNDHCLACFTAGGWRFVEPFDGLVAFLRSEGLWAVYRGAWEIGVIRGASLVVAGSRWWEHRLRP